MNAGTDDDRGVLANAWERYAVYDHNAIRAQKRFLQLRNGVLLMGLAAMALAIVYDEYVAVGSTRPPMSDWRFFVWLPMIAMPVLGSVLAAAAAKLVHGADWISLRGAAEAVKREIFRYRCRVGVFDPENDAPGTPDEMLAAAVSGITQRLMETTVVAGHLEPVERSWPPAASQGDDGACELTPEQYLEWRVGDQQGYFRRTARRLERRHRHFQWWIYGFGGIGTLLAALGLEIWVPVSVGVATALTSYLEVRSVESKLAGYNRAALELDNVETWWSGLTPAQRTQRVSFTRLVGRTETVLGSENAGWLEQMRDALAKLAEAEKS